MKKEVFINFGSGRTGSQPWARRPLWERIVSTDPSLAKRNGIPLDQPPYNDLTEQSKWEDRTIDVLADSGRS